jgi:glycosyltransferase involved in cell wall biosynthesis
MDELRVMCVAKRWVHHTASGGYDQLAGAVGAEVVRRPTRRSILGRVAARLWRLVSHPKPYLFDYRYEDWLAELYVLGRSQCRPPDVVHLLYGDEQLDLLLRRRQVLSCPLIATFHLPPHRVRERFEKTQKHLVSGIDVAVVVARSQLEAFGNWLGADRVIYVPHGIDTDRFCPGEGLPRREYVRLITVGYHMRDWKALDEIIDQCQARKLAVRFDIVCSGDGLGWKLPRDEQDRISRWVNLPNVDFHSRISEEHLIRLYREADALLLPVRDATATNSALEALACGTPVISTRVGGMPDYVDNACGWLFEKAEVGRIVKLISDICDEREIASSRRGAARGKALVFSWKRVAARMRTVYESVTHHHCLETAAAEWE